MSSSPPSLLHLFTINAGSCNGCDVELAATEAVSRFDVAQLGCAYCNSPSEADIVLVTGPLTSRMREVVLALHAAAPAPTVTVAIGVCSVSCGVFRDSYAVDGPLQRYLPIDINVPGCPPRPQAILAGIAQAVGRIRGREQAADEAPDQLREEPAAKRLRGRPTFSAHACTGCGMCVHVCAAGAIRLTEEGSGFRFTLWENSCVFCGLCAHYCPSRALNMSGNWRLGHAAADQFARTETGEVTATACEECGEPFLPAPPELVRRAYRGGGPEAETLRGLCSDCRRASTAKGILKGMKR